VFGEGPARAALMLIGEQPGDAEDLSGHPFVGPSGKLLDRALADAGIDRATVYLTNVVKHFKFEPRGKRRIHKTPAQREVAACHVWLDEELAAVHPRVIVALGATALGAVMGKRMTITAARESALVAPGGAQLVATYHPSAVLRAPEAARRDQLYAILVADLAEARRKAERD